MEDLGLKRLISHVAIAIRKQTRRVHTRLHIDINRLLTIDVHIIQHLDFQYS